MQNTGCWNSTQKQLFRLVVFISLFLQIETVIACEAPPKVCDWKKKIVSLKTENMIASGILIDGGLILHEDISHAFSPALLGLWHDNLLDSASSLAKEKFQLLLRRCRCEVVYIQREIPSSGRHLACCIFQSRILEVFFCSRYP